MLSNCYRLVFLVMIRIEVKVPNMVTGLATSRKLQACMCLHACYAARNCGRCNTFHLSVGSGRTHYHLYPFIT